MASSLDSMTFDTSPSYKRCEMPLHENAGFVVHPYDPLPKTVRSWEKVGEERAIILYLTYKMSCFDCLRREVDRDSSVFIASSCVKPSSRRAWLPRLPKAEGSNTYFSSAYLESPIAKAARFELFTISRWREITCSPFGVRKVSLQFFLFLKN
jgi:hypothetical protein